MNYFLLFLISLGIQSCSFASAKGKVNKIKKNIKNKKKLKKISQAKMRNMPPSMSQPVGAPLQIVQQNTLVQNKQEDKSEINKKSETFFSSNLKKHAKGTREDLMINIFSDLILKHNNINDAEKIQILLKFSSLQKADIEKLNRKKLDKTSPLYEQILNLLFDIALSLFTKAGFKKEDLFIESAEIKKHADLSQKSIANEPKKEKKPIVIKNIPLLIEKLNSYTTQELSSSLEMIVDIANPFFIKYDLVDDIKSLSSCLLILSLAQNCLPNLNVNSLKLALNGAGAVLDSVMASFFSIDDHYVPGFATEQDYKKAILVKMISILTEYYNQIYFLSSAR